MSMDLFGHTPEPRPRARRTDPAPSHAAAHKAAAFAGTHEEKILSFLSRIFPRAAHAESIGAAIGLTTVQVDRRRAGLLASGQIILVGEGTFANGSPAGLWRLAGQPERRAA